MPNLSPSLYSSFAPSSSSSKVNASAIVSNANAQYSSMLNQQSPVQGYCNQVFGSHQKSQNMANLYNECLASAGSLSYTQQSTCLNNFSLDSNPYNFVNCLMNNASQNPSQNPSQNQSVSSACTSYYGPYSVSFQSSITDVQTFVNAINNNCNDYLNQQYQQQQQGYYN